MPNRRTALSVLFVGMIVAAGIPLTAAMPVSLIASVESPAPVGTRIHWTASMTGDETPKLWYRFRARELGSEFHLVRDYGPIAELDWTAADHEGVYEIEVSVRNLDTGETAADSRLFLMTSRVTDGTPVVNPTPNSLVFLYSAPPCPDGSRMRVQFATPDGFVQVTPFVDCTTDTSMNFYLAGLRPLTAYVAHHILDTGTEFINGPDLAFTSGEVLPGLLSQTVITEPGEEITEHLLLGSSLGGPSVATDLDGTPVWWGPPDVSFITRPERGGYFWAIRQDHAGDSSSQTIRKFDLMGMTLLETNAARVNEQLAALGRRTIGAFHHEVETLPGGRIVALATVEQILANVQGADPVDIIGDMIIVFDPDLNVVWTWDTFDNLDVTRAAVLGETCLNAGACPVYFLAPDANDWTHGNAVQQTPDGNLLYSSRHQDWLIKIDYNRGEGDGHVLWRLGKDGDFTYNSSDAYPWFSHQHDGNFDFMDPSMLMVFDNGNTRVQQQDGGNSRGQVIHLDEANRTASLELNADLGVYSVAVGSAQRLHDGNYHFDGGFVFEEGKIYSYSIEVDEEGNVVYNVRANTALYRSFRMRDLYTPK